MSNGRCTVSRAFDGIAVDAIHELVLFSRKSRVPVCSLGESAPLTYDSTKRKLYIADRRPAAFGRFRWRTKRQTSLGLDNLI